MEVAIMKNLLTSWVECSIQDRSKLDSLTSNVRAEKSRSLYEDKWNITGNPVRLHKQQARSQEGKTQRKCYFKDQKQYNQKKFTFRFVVDFRCCFWAETIRWNLRKNGHDFLSVLRFSFISVDWRFKPNVFNDLEYDLYLEFARSRITLCSEHKIKTWAYSSVHIKHKIKTWAYSSVHIKHKIKTWAYSSIHIKHKIKTQAHSIVHIKSDIKFQAQSSVFPGYDVKLIRCCPGHNGKTAAMFALPSE